MVDVKLARPVLKFFSIISIITIKILAVLVKVIKHLFYFLFNGYMFAGVLGYFLWRVCRKRKQSCLGRFECLRLPTIATSPRGEYHSVSLRM